MTFALNSSNINSPLIFLQGEDNRFMAIEMMNRKIYFIWNLGSDSGKISHPMEVQTRDPQYDDAWYKVEISRHLNIGSILVSRMSKGGTSFETSHADISTATSLDFTRFVVTQNNRVYLGGVPDTLRPKELQSVNGLSVIVHQIFIDNIQLGLWHFASTDGKCSGAMFGATESSDSSNKRHFNGYGYSVVRSLSSRTYPKKIFSLQMTFKTLDENALLFLTVDEKNVKNILIFSCWYFFIILILEPFNIIDII